MGIILRLARYGVMVVVLAFVFMFDAVVVVIPRTAERSFWTRIPLPLVRIESTDLPPVYTQVEFRYGDAAARIGEMVSSIHPCEFIESFQTDGWQVRIIMGLDTAGAVDCPANRNAVSLAPEFRRIAVIQACAYETGERPGLVVGVVSADSDPAVVLVPGIGRLLRVPAECLLVEEPPMQPVETASADDESKIMEPAGALGQSTNPPESEDPGNTLPPTADSGGEGESYSGSIPSHPATLDQLRARVRVP